MTIKLDPSEAYKEYVKCLQLLNTIRERNFGNDSKEEDEFLDYMDGIWIQLSTEDIEKFQFLGVKGAMESFDNET